MVRYCRSNQFRLMPNHPGASPRILIRNPEFDYFQAASWSKDSRLVLASIEKRTSGALKTSGTIIRPTLSPDGRWVAYGLLPEQENQTPGIYLLGTDGTRETLAVPNDNRPVAWSPDSSRLYYLGNRTGNFSLWSVVVASGKATGTPELVRPDTGLIDSMGMTREGTLYYLVRGANRTNIYSAELALGSAVRSALVNDLRLNALGASLSPDGKSLAYFISRMTGPTPVTGSEQTVIVRSLETGKERDFVQDQVRLPPAGAGGRCGFRTTSRCSLQRLSSKSPAVSSSGWISQPGIGISSSVRLSRRRALRYLLTAKRR